MDGFNTVRHAAGEGDNHILRNLFPDGFRFRCQQPVVQAGFIPNPCRCFQRCRQRPCQLLKFLLIHRIPNFQWGNTIQNRGNIRNPLVFIKLQQSPAHVQAPGCYDFPLLNQRQIAGAAADIHVQHRFSRLFRQFQCARAFRRQHALQIRPCRGYHKLPGKIRQGFQRGLGVFLPGGLPGDDDRAGVHALSLNAGGSVFRRNDLPQPGSIHPALVQKRREIDRTAVKDLPPGNLHLRHRKGTRPVFHCQLRQNHLGGGGTDVQSHAPQPFRHGRSPPPESAGSESPPPSWDLSCSRDRPAMPPRWRSYCAIPPED